jgi:hypothetical protein
VDGQLGRIATLMQSVGTASNAQLAAMSGTVAAAIGQSEAIAADARAQSAQAESAASSQRLSDARREAQQTIAALDDDLYKRKIFDRYLEFKSDEDKRAYREREEENRRALAAARAKGTAEGDLEALAIERRQMLDAGAHGADRSPEWQKRMEQMDEVRGNLRAAMRENGKDAKVADAIERDSTRAFLKSKGLSENEIDQAMRRGHSVAAVIEPYLSKTTEPSTSPSQEKSNDHDKRASPRLQQLADALRAAGVTPTDSATSDGHGVKIDAAATINTAVRGA